jgi:hypothetical protein
LNYEETMNKTSAIIGAIMIVLAILPGCGKKKPTVDMAAVNDGVVAVNNKLPIKLGVDLTLTKASAVGDQVQFDYTAPYPSKTQLPPRATGLMRGYMVRYACDDPGARAILNAGMNINHRVTDIEGHELYTTVGDLAVCSLYDAH